MKLRIAAVATALLVARLATPAGAQLACSTVARAGQLDPDGVSYRNRFRDEVAMNAGGDAVFIARARGARDKLYFYPGAGAGEVVARADGPAPGGGAFRSQRTFFFPSVNDGGDVAFLGHLVSGQGVFVRAGGVLEAGAVRSLPSPGGGVFDSFSMVGDIDATSRVPFVARVFGGPGGVFLYASATDALSGLVLDGTPTLEGRMICVTHAVDSRPERLRDDPRRVQDQLRGSRRVGAARHLPGHGARHLDRGPGRRRRPGIGSSFVKFFDTPRINASNDIAFRATTSGTTKTDGIFLWSYATASISTVVRTTDAAPSVGGSFAANQSFNLSDAGDVILNARIKRSTARFGIFELGAVDVPALVETDAPPTDAFAPGAIFTRFSKTSASSADGSRIALRVRVLDLAPPPTKEAVIRCAGSPSGAFVDGAAFF